MEYKVEVHFVSGVCGVTHMFEPFECKGNSIDACNQRVSRAIEENERGITKFNLKKARVYVEGRETLEVDYYSNKIRLSLSDIVDNWVNLLDC
jgi:hypothetical protein